jgi:DNA-binding response OmpR family regulator
VRAGADNYLTKPFSIEELQAKIMECLEEVAV